MEQWIPLTEYSRAHGLSISTLRRRIKAGDIEYKLAEGKYLLRNSSSPVNEQKVSSNVPTAPPPPLAPPAIEAKPASDNGAQEFLAITHELVGEIKKAFSLVLQEKEKHIQHLREELTDLKTLVRVLEDENARLEKRHAKTMSNAVPGNQSTVASISAAAAAALPQIRPAKNLIKEELDASSWLNSPSEF